MKLNKLMKQQLVLLKNIKKNKRGLKDLLDEVNSHWCYEDYVYRYYHHSFKVFYIQAFTEKTVMMLIKLNPGTELNRDFVNIINKGTNKKFKLSMNKNWGKHTKPLLEAFFHAKYFLEMIIKYGEKLEKPVSVLPSGWASVLYLYNIR